MKLGRNWYQVHWHPPETMLGWSPIETAIYFAEAPRVVDVLAKSKPQAIAIAKDAWPQIEFALLVAPVLAGSERQFQETMEPAGEVNVDLIPY